MPMGERDQTAAVAIGLRTLFMLRGFALPDALLNDKVAYVRELLVREVGEPVALILPLWRWAKLSSENHAKLHAAKAKAVARGYSAHNVEQASSL